MTLREMRAAVSGLIADPGEEKVNWGEIIQFLNLGQNFFAGHIWNIERDKFLKISKQGATNGVSEYVITGEVREIVQVIYRGQVSQRLPSKEVGVVSVSPTYRPVFGSSQFFNEMGSSVGKSKILLYPTPVTAHGINGTTDIEVWYYLKPRPLHVMGSYNGSVTGGVSTSGWTDSNTPFSGSGENFYDNGEFRFSTGNLKNITGRCTFQAAGGVYTVAYVSPTHVTVLPMAPAAGDFFEVDQVPDIPSQYHHLIVLYAAGLAAPKAGRDGSLFTDQWQMELEMMRLKYNANVEAVMPGMGWGNTSPYQQQGA